MPTYIAKLSEEGLDLFIADFRGQSTDEDFAVTGLGLLWVDLFVVDDVIAGGDDLIDRVGILVHDEGKSSRATRVGICLDVYALDLTILAKVFLQFLCSRGWKKTALVNLMGFSSYEICGLK